MKIEIDVHGNVVISANVKLTDNLTAEQVTIDPDITLDLNGYTLTYRTIVRGAGSKILPVEGDFRRRH